MNALADFTSPYFIPLICIIQGSSAYNPLSIWTTIKGIVFPHLNCKFCTLNN